MGRESALRSELAEMMIEMLVHQDRPLCRRERSEESVRMSGAGCGAACDEAIDRLIQARPFDLKVSLILHYQVCDCGGISAHRLVVSQGDGLDDWTEEPTDELPRGTEVS